MFIIIGLGIVAGSILLGFLMEGGKIGALMQFTEFIIIGGAGLGSVLIANPLSTVMATFRAIIGLLKGNPYTKPCYMELLRISQRRVESSWQIQNSNLEKMKMALSPWEMRL